jgi:ribosomal protein S18 acetylase RimI-like enzyme
VPDLAEEIYRLLYAAVAKRWIELGLDVHYVYVPAADRHSMEVWFSLGFGHDNTYAARETNAAAAELPASMLIREAAASDDQILVEQGIGILHDLTVPPAFLAPPLDRMNPAMLQLVRDLLNKPEIPQWLAFRNGEAVGMLLFAKAEDNVPALLAPDRSIYLLGAYTAPTARGQGIGTAMLARSFRWAREADYHCCALDYLPANLAGSRFWQRSGFRSLAYRLCRQLDERVLRT